MLVLAMPVLSADERSLALRIDDLIALKFDGRQPAPTSDDAEFLRRICLDLAGRIPTADETRRFLDNSAPDKRTQMIDQLLAAPAYAQRMQELFHVVLMERRGDNDKWTHYLRTAFEQNKHWDQIVRELLYPDAEDESRRGAGFFYTKRIEANGQNPVDYPGLTRDVGRLFLGADLQCAQCHNHLFIEDYKQQDFQGLYSVYLNLSVKSGLDFPAVTEKAMDKKLEFVSVFDPTPHQTGPRIPFAKDIEVPEQVKDGPPVSVLALLAHDFPTPENRLFSKNIANRLWFVMMGRGLVHPLDLHHSGNPPSHSELLDLLASEFAAHQYDIKWMLRELALTQTYQRSGRYPTAVAAENGEPAVVNLDQIPPQSYLLFNEKRLLAEQLLYSTLQATGNLDRLLQPTAEGKPNPELVDLTAKYIAAFANEPREPEDQINPTVKGALFTLNDETSLHLLSRQPGNLIDRLMAMTDGQLLAEELYLSVFTRKPTDDERTELVAWLAQHSDDREKAIKMWAWSMLTSMEFVVNH
ncbi:MAG: DUF1549 domain-containing protein [Fuerstia sp.]|nr:DUF1549 domain-containing protein [Fuerstiella sp.]